MISPLRGSGDGSGSATRTTVGATAITVATVVPVFLVGGLAVQIGAELGFTPAGLGLAVAIYFGVGALTTIPAGALVERYGAVVTARTAIVLSAGCLLAIAVAARNFPVLIVLLAAGAAANGMGQLAANAFLARVPARRQGLSFGVKQAAIPTATLLAGASVPAVALTLGWRWAFVFASATAALALALVPRPPARPRGPAPGTLPAADGGGRPAPPTRGRATGPLVIIGVAVGLGAAAAGSMGIFLVDAAVGRGLNPGLAGLTLTLGSVACVTGRVIGGWLFDRRGARGDVLTVAFTMAIGAAGLALLAAPGIVPLAAGVLLGFGFGWVFPGLVNVAVVQLHPHAPAAATSITQTGVYAGGSLGPLAFGAVATAASYPVAWLGAAAGMLLAATLVLAGRRRLHRSSRLPATS